MYGSSSCSINVNTVGYSPHSEICPAGIGCVGHQAVVHELGANHDSCGYSPHLVSWPTFLATAGLYPSWPSIVNN